MRLAQGFGQLDVQWPHQGAVPVECRVRRAPPTGRPNQLQTLTSQGPCEGFAVVPTPHSAILNRPACLARMLGLSTEIPLAASACAPLTRAECPPNRRSPSGDRWGCPQAIARTSKVSTIFIFVGAVPLIVWQIGSSDTSAWQRPRLSACLVVSSTSCRSKCKGQGRSGTPHKHPHDRVVPNADGSVLDAMSFHVTVHASSSKSM